MLFKKPINGKESWAKLFQSIEVFTPLMENIFARHQLSFTRAENCTPGTNAVFAVGEYIIKIFAPEESGFGSREDFFTERFGLTRANTLGICAPKLIAQGTVQDAYRFDYLIMERVKGCELEDCLDTLSEPVKLSIGSQLRSAVEKLDTPCENFNHHTLCSCEAMERWHVFPKTFLKERETFLQGIKTDSFCFVHNDLTSENILLDETGRIMLIDFADAMIAPREVELACILCEGFHLDQAFMCGYLGAFEPLQLAQDCMKGLLLHDYGANIISQRIAPAGKITSLETLRTYILRKLQ